MEKREFVPAFIDQQKKIDRLTAENATLREERDKAREELEKAEEWIHLTKCHAPYEAAGATWEQRHLEDVAKYEKAETALEQARKPWRVVLVGKNFERHDCDVDDVGFSDRVLVVNSDYVNALEQARLDSHLAGMEEALKIALEYSSTISVIPYQIQEAIRARIKEISEGGSNA